MEEEKDRIFLGRVLYLFWTGRKEETGSNTTRKKCGVRSGTTRFQSPPDLASQPSRLFEVESISERQFKKIEDILGVDGYRLGGWDLVLPRSGIQLRWRDCPWLREFNILK